MFILTKHDYTHNRNSIIDVVKDDYLMCYDSLLKDLKQYQEKDHHSIKNIDQNRIEVYNKCYTGNYLMFVYEIHEFPKPSENVINVKLKVDPKKKP